MLELIQKLIGKRCIIHTFNGQLCGTITEATAGGILINDGGNSEIINLDFIVRVSEYPVKKSAKKKSDVL